MIGFAGFGSRPDVWMFRIWVFWVIWVMMIGDDWELIGNFAGNSGHRGRWDVVGPGWAIRAAAKRPWLGLEGLMSVLGSGSGVGVDGLVVSE